MIPHSRPPLIVLPRLIHCYQGRYGVVKQVVLNTTTKSGHRALSSLASSSSYCYLGSKGNHIGTTASSRSPPISSSFPGAHNVTKFRIMEKQQLFSPQVISSRGYNFASGQYASAFRDLPVPNSDSLRQSALKYLDEFDKRTWYDDPICSILKGEKLLAPPSNLWITKDALGIANGHQYHATPEQVKTLMNHIRTYRSPHDDIRPQLRRIEHLFLTKYSGFLIGNQCIDFQKQDGVTEIEESIMANSVERNLNDMLLADEKGGKVSIQRKPIYVSCVSNFTNFLDLFRKTIRNLELGVPCIVLGRSNTVQHSYRWTELLVDLMKEEGLDLGMVTYLSCTLDDIKHITRTCKEHTGMLYSTCSRELAADIKSGYPNTIASTGGPNTLFTTEWTEGVQEAIRMSATIESSGQCTALRHCVVPETVSATDVEKLFDPVKGIPSATEALRGKMFDCVFENHGGSPAPDVKHGQYMKHSKSDVYYRIGGSMPDDGIQEYWRKAVVDVSTTAPGAELDASANGKIETLAKWLNRNQPISLAANAPRDKAFMLGRSLFEKTGLVVYTVGSTNDANHPPALTCQARPQEGEIFGEFPPRKKLETYTKFPVYVPSSTPAYDSAYQPYYLESLHVSDLKENLGEAAEIIADISNSAVEGFCIELLNYLSDVTANNPKRGFGTVRTALWGLQRPPIIEGVKTCIRCDANIVLDDVAPVFLPFYATNARTQVELSVDSSNKGLLQVLKKHGIDVTVEDANAFKARMEAEEEKYYNVVTIKGPMNEFPMVGQFVSLYFPLGHIKSTMSGDEEFAKYFEESDKWLKMHSVGVENDEC